ncbi:MAG: tRNA (adenosine(37)-N6)-dimethylallyltransferase MiaA, partial [Firmicutes bacterium]|nr:tRNA (adenosine(37)-N6)-dimethylallyltransferase MiaA [Bacillota bacterium]
TGEGIPEFEQSFVKTEDFEPVLFCLDRDRGELHQRINLRAKLLFEAGLIDEVKGLLSEGLDASDISMKGIGYKEVIAHLQGEYDEDRALELVQRNSRRYARRQLIWFRRNPEMHWFNISDYEEENRALEEFLRQVKEALHG